MMIAYLLFLVLARALPEGLLELNNAPSGSNYVYIPSKFAVNRKDAVKACKSIGMSVAPIPSVEDLMWVGGLIKEEAWIDGFRGRLTGECVAAFRGGAVAIPVGECESLHAVLCK